MRAPARRIARAERIGGLPTLVARTRANLAAVAAWEERSDWASFLAADPRTRSSTSICLRLDAPWFAALPSDHRAPVANRLATLLHQEGAALDAASYRDAPPGLRLWGGATVETADLEAALPWLDWAWAETMRLTGV